MDPTLEALLCSWPVDPWVVVPLLVLAGIYLRGWLTLRRRGASRFGHRQLACFLGGLGLVFLALNSPIEPLSVLLLQVHMVQHLLLTLAVPILLWLGEPLVPLLAGLPRWVRQDWVVPVLRLDELQRCWQFLTGPVVAWLLFVLATWVWHVPAFYELALRSDGWHVVEHAIFLGTGLLFWWPVVQPFPSRPRYARALLIPYLLLADLANTPLAALLTYSRSVLYPHYLKLPGLAGIAALDDQATAGVLMWVLGSLAYLVPLVAIAGQALYGTRSTSRRARETLVASGSNRGLTPPARLGRIPLTVLARAPSTPDLLNVPLLGRFLKWRHARLVLQLPLLVLAVLVVVDGVTGPQAAPMNLAGVLPWIHWRGLLVLALLALGNVFCMGCPFMVPRGIAKWLFPAKRSWPRWLRSKWLAIAVVAAFFWAYEAFALWASPWWTAWIVVGYFITAFAVDAVFHGAAFCKYVCPIGQFNFVQSLVSPLEVRAVDPEVCQTCRTRDCIRGRAGIPGCELHLNVPRKIGNMDCTLCLDCVHACPHDNIGLVPVVPGTALRHESAGAWTRRPDVAALAVVLVFAAFVNASGMVGPVLEWQDRLTQMLHASSPRPVKTGMLLGGLFVLPLLAVSAAAAMSRWCGGTAGPWRTATGRFALALVPLGAAMWLDHYLFHLVTSAGAIVPVTQRFAADWGVALLGEPQWGCGCCVAAPDWLLRLEIFFLDIGVLTALYVGYSLARARATSFGQAVQVFAPWGLLMLLLFAWGVWIVFQPMEMRGLAELAR